METNISFFGLSKEADKLKLQIIKKIDNKKAEIDSLKNKYLEFCLKKKRQNTMCKI